MAKLCITVTADSMAELRRRRDQCSGADLVELRLDTVRDPSGVGAVADRSLPVVVTCRPTWEGGHFTGSEEERHRILQEALAAGADYVDVEWRAGFSDLVTSRGGRNIVLSMHDFSGVPGDLADRAAAMRAVGAEVTKIAVMAHRLTDCLPLLSLGSSEVGAEQMVLIAMGDAGLITRVLPSKFGSAWTYAGEGVAPGQMSGALLRERFSFYELSEWTAVYGVVGRPIAHSLSPAIHNAAFRAARRDAVYLPFAAADFDDFLAFAEAIPVHGVSITAPFKGDAFRHAAHRDALSEKIGAANTLRKRGAEWEACNTDVAGFIAPLARRIDVRGLRATVLGAGGAARAAVEALQSAGAAVTICSRSADRARPAFHGNTNVTIGAWPPQAGSWDVLVNATPAGTAPNDERSPLPDGPFTGRLVYDLVYNPPLTRLLREARAAGCEALGGLDMLIAQAREQFQWWTGTAADEDVMRSAALDALADGESMARSAPGVESHQFRN